MTGARPRGRPKKESRQTEMSDEDIRKLMRTAYGSIPILDRRWDTISVIKLIKRLDHEYLQVEDVVADASGDGIRIAHTRDKAAAADKIDANIKRQAAKHRDRKRGVSPERPRLLPRKVRERERRR